MFQDAYVHAQKCDLCQRQICKDVNFRSASSTFFTFIFILYGSNSFYIINIYVLHYSCNRAFDKEDGSKAVKKNDTKIASMFWLKNIIT